MPYIYTHKQYTTNITTPRILIIITTVAIISVVDVYDNIDNSNSNYNYNKYKITSERKESSEDFKHAHARTHTHSHTHTHTHTHKLHKILANFRVFILEIHRILTSARERNKIL